MYGFFIPQTCRREHFPFTENHHYVNQNPIFFSDKWRGNPYTRRQPWPSDCPQDQRDECGHPGNRVTWFRQNPADIDGECQ